MAREKEWLEYILPADKIGYAEYRNKIQDLFVIGNGRFGESNLILGSENDRPDLSAPSAPMFASGNIICREAEIYVLIHEEFEDKIEIDISNLKGKYIPEQLTETSRWSYSYWKPGDNAPGDNSEIREIRILIHNIVIAIAKSQKRLWVHEFNSGINYFIPVTNFFNEIMRLREIKYAKNLPRPDSIFTDSNSYSDDEITLGFLNYNKHWKKIDIDYTQQNKAAESKKKKSFLDLFKFRG